MAKKDEAALWYKDAIIYELHIRTFFDSNGDGIGDFAGLTEKLDYLQDLGVTALWLLPFCPSPLKDDGYDIADYSNINPDYGSLKDFKRFLKEAHRRGFKVISELVLNHTSDQHEWFQRARKAPPGSPERDFYVWTQDPNKYPEVRIIFPDYESSNWSWDPVAKAYYWHRFFHHQPDLNFDNPKVREAMLNVVDFWFENGVDGMRLDAIPYLFEREGTDCVGLPETHAFLKMLRRHVDSKFANRMFLAEANMWPEDAVSFFGDGDECHMSFHFPIMPRLFMSVKMENRYPLEEILEQTPVIHETCQWANFLRNHDELTLEMVTDEERDYMYRSFIVEPQAKINAGIRRRLAPLMRNNRKQIELLNGLLFSLIGTPVIYYGDEIGMGDNIYLGDRNGVRTPMQWSSDRNAGFSRANPQKLVFPIVIDPEYHFEAVNVEAQQNNPHSLLWWMRRLIEVRKRYKAFSRGDLKFVDCDNHKILVFIRTYGDEQILVIANLSRYSQGTHLDLSPWKGKVLVELFSHNPFPKISKEPYFFTLTPHSFYWFAIETPQEEQPPIKGGKVPESWPVLELEGKWDKVLSQKNLNKLVEHIPQYLKRQHWFFERTYKIRHVKILGEISLFTRGVPGFLMLIQVNFVDHEPQANLVGLNFGTGKKFQSVKKHYPHQILCEVKIPEENWEGGLYNAISDPDFSKLLLDYLMKGRTIKSSMGTIKTGMTKAFKSLKKTKGPITPKILEREYNNTVVLYGKKYVLKIFRQLEWGINPEWEMGQYLTEKKFSAAPKLLGTAEYHVEKQTPVILCILYEYLDHQGSAFDYSLESLHAFYETVLSTQAAGGKVPLPKGGLLKLAEQELPDEVRNLLGPYVGSAERMGALVAKFHQVMAEAPEKSDLAAEDFPPHYQRSLYQSVLSLIKRTNKIAQKMMGELPPGAQKLANEIISKEDQFLGLLKPLVEDIKIDTIRIRCHGDLHLGQLLHTGKDFKMIDFEGEGDRHWSARRLKRSAFRDLASMIRSFEYASQAALRHEATQEMASRENISHLEKWADYWARWAGVAFLRAYQRELDGSELWPQGPEARELLLGACLMEKGFAEIQYEISHRTEWLEIPLKGMLKLLARVS